MDKKEAFLKKDRIIKAITEDGFFKLSVVKTTDVVRQAQKRHELGLLATVLLGRALTGTMLLASELKAEERVRLKMEGNGPLGMLTAEANSTGEIRGFVQNKDAVLDYDTAERIGDGLGLGVLSVSKTLYDEARPTTGTVELISGNVSQDLSHYLMQSEQVRSAISLDVGINDNGEVTHAGGVLIQALPGAPDEKIEKVQENFATMPAVAEQLADGSYIDDILNEIIGPYKIKELGRWPVHFFCRCSKDRFKGALKMLGVDELRDMLDQGQELVCHFCNSRYVVRADELQAIIDENQTRMN